MKRSLLNKIFIVLGVIIFVSAGCNSTARPSYQANPDVKGEIKISVPTQQTQQQNNLSNDNYYINSQGNSVHSPAYSNDGGVPAGASAKCRDGTYSFSQSRRGTCSHHGGVARWY